MNTQTQSATATPFTIHSATRLGHIYLTVASLAREISFYRTVLNMKLHWREGVSADLGAGEEDLLRLTEVPGAQRVRHTTGLYHFAVLYPSRRELARAIARLFQLRHPNYPTDHFIRETTYLDDPEGQNIELYIRTYPRGLRPGLCPPLLAGAVPGRAGDEDIPPSPKAETSSCP